MRPAELTKTVFMLVAIGLLATACNGADKGVPGQFSHYLESVTRQFSHYFEPATRNFVKEEEDLSHTNPPPALIPQAAWRLKYVDSEELKVVYRPASNAFDGDPSTVWHTQSSGQRLIHPMKFKLIWGSCMILTDFVTCLPRMGRLMAG